MEQAAVDSIVALCPLNGVISCWIRATDLVAVNVKTDESRSSVMHWDLGGAAGCRLDTDELFPVEIRQSITDAISEVVYQSIYGKKTDLADFAITPHELLEFAHAQPHPTAKGKVFSSLHIIVHDQVAVNDFIGVAPSHLCAAFIHARPDDDHERTYTLLLYYAAPAGVQTMVSTTLTKGINDPPIGLAKWFTELVRTASVQIHMRDPHLQARCVVCDKKDRVECFPQHWRDDDDGGGGDRGVCGACTRDKAIADLAMLRHVGTFRDDVVEPRRSQREAVKRKRK
jgi:hypothetical protein